MNDVIFRRFRDGGDVIAIFPALPGTRQWWRDCESYQRIGQHGACGLDYVSSTRPAAEADPDVIALRRELESGPAPYRLRVVKRFTRAHDEARRGACK